MVVLRATQKVRLAPEIDASSSVSDTALGDWYVNKLVVDRRPLLILVSAASLLPILLIAREVRELPKRLPDLVRRRLERLGVASSWIEAEVRGMNPVIVGKTADRSVVGIVVEFGRMLPSYLTEGEWDETTLPFAESRLAQTPCYAGKRFEDCVFPYKKTPELLAARWGNP